MEAEREVVDLCEDLIKAEQRTRLQLLRAIRKSPSRAHQCRRGAVHSITRGYQDQT
jgi:hypothetical protein